MINPPPPPKPPTPHREMLAATFLPEPVKAEEPKPKQVDVADAEDATGKVEAEAGTKP